MLFTNAAILKSASSQIIGNGFLQINDDKIVAIGEMKNLTDNVDSGDTIDLEGKLLIPGIINAHNHCAMTLYRGLADDLELNEWLQDHIFPAEAVSVSKEMVYWCTKLAAAEMLLSGTTTVADGYFFSGEAAKALAEVGMRGVVAHGVVDFPAPSVPDPTKNIDALRNHLDTWQEKNPLITPAIFAHAPYTCSPKTLVAAKKLADERGCRFFIHIAESPLEQEKIIDPQGQTPVQHLAALDLLGPNTVCIHAIWLDDEDLEILKNTKTHVVLCPQSNMKLASGISKATKMLAMGISVGIGTDGCASNNGLDMFREMDMLAKIQKVNNLDATALTAKEALTCSTVTNANILGLEGLGSLTIGGKADFVIIDTKNVSLTPFFNQDLLVYSAPGSHVDCVVINGKLVVKSGKIISFDLEETLQKVRDLANIIKDNQVPPTQS